MDGKRKHRYDLIKEKRRKSEGAQALLELPNLTAFLQEELVEATDCVTTTDVHESTTETCETQTDTNSCDIQALEAEIKSLREDNSKVREQLKEVSLDENGFRDNNEKVLFYTGLPSWNLLYCIYNFQRLLLTLIRLRLNLSGKDLA